MVTCKTPNCGKEATLSCPTCIKLGLAPARFCSQECFKGNWGEHKSVHKAAKENIIAMLNATGSGEGGKFDGYEFSGSLRPAEVTPQKTVPSHIVKPDYADHPTGIPISEQKDKNSNTMIKKYSTEELEGVRAACRVGRAVLDAASAALRPGITTDAIDCIVHEETVKRGAYPSPLNYHCFPKSVCTSVNEVICHGIPDLRPLEDGDIVNLDISVYIGGFHADLNETFCVGSVDAKGQMLVECAFKALAAAVSQVRPGTLYRDVGMAISNVTKGFGCSVVRAYCGHGVGTLFHTAPNIPHYAKNKAKGVMQPGHVFTIEPMINLGSYRDTMWPDNWTAPTADGQRSAQFEHTMLVTETGVELLTAREGEPTDKMVWNAETWQR